MNWEIEYNEVDKIIIVKAEGVLDASSQEKLLNEVLEWIKKYNCLRLLLDHKKVSELEIGIFDIHEIPQKYHTEKLPHKIKMAILYNENQKEKYKFYETVTFNFGYHVSLFTELESAIKWLKN